MSSEQVNVPPSPFGSFSTPPLPPSEGPALPVRRSERIRNLKRAGPTPIDSTGAAVKKKLPVKSKSVATKNKLDAIVEATKVVVEKAQQPFRFLDLPGGTYLKPVTNDIS